MNIFGQGSNIMRLTLPFLIIAILCNIFLPDVSALPETVYFLKPIGYILLILGLILWIAGLVQLIIFFPKGALVTNGAYAICRNPVYSSYIIFILPAVAFITLTWVYLAVAVIMYLALKYFIRKEEDELIRVFGEDYLTYMKKVPRVLPFIGPLSSRS